MSPVKPLGTKAGMRGLRIYYPDFLPLLTAVLSVAPALNTGTFAALIFSSSPVLGLRPVRAARVRTSKDPNPVKDRESPFLRVSAIISVSAATACSTLALLEPVLIAMASMSSFLFMGKFSSPFANRRRNNQGGLIQVSGDA